MADILKYDMTDLWASSGDKVAPDASKIHAGWGVEVVPRQWWNWFENRQDQNIAYMLQKGFPEWDVTTEYIINKSYVQRNGVVYKAVATNTNVDPVLLTSWVRAFIDYTVANDALGTITPAADRLPYFNGANTATYTTLTSFARTLLDDTSSAAALTTLGGQTLNSNLTALSAVSAATNALPYFTSTTVMGVATLTAYGRSLIGVADAATARTTLGLGNVATLNIGTTTGTVAAGDDSRIVNALQKGNNLSEVTNAATARTNISAQTLNNNLTALSGITGAADLLPYFTAAGAMTTTTMTAFGRSVVAAVDAATARTTLVAAKSGANTDITSLSSVTLNGTTVLGKFTESLVTLASATTTDIGSAAGNVITVTGTTTITALGTAPAGTRKQVRFAGVLVLTHSSSVLSLPTTTNITTAVDDVAEFRSLGSGNWFCTEYNRANGQPLAVVSVAQGGTGATTQAAALAALQGVGYDTTTGSATLPAGTTAQRTGSPVNGMVRYNSDSTQFEGYQGGAWGQLGPTPNGRNRIINGDCRVAQRGANGVYTNGVAGYGGPDRFLGNNAGAGGQFTQSQGTLVDGVVTKNCVTQTVNTVVSDLSTTKFWSGILQFIEGVNCYDLVGQPITISFLFKASVAGTYSVAVRDSTGAYSYISTFTVSSNVVTKVIVNVPAIPSGASIPNTSAIGMSVWIGAQNTGTYVTSTLNTWQNASYIVANTQTPWGSTSGATISVADLQLETGTVATPFERRSYEHEQLLCQRYYSLAFASARFTASAASQYSNTPIYWPSMRATPTVALLVAGTSNLATSVAATAAGLSAGRFELISSASGDSYALNYLYSLSAEL